MTLTLHYFPLRARAEPLKMILGHCKISYVDRQVPFAEWGAWKASGSVPPGKTGGVQLPVLELEDGTLLPESLDIAKHVWTLGRREVTPRRLGPPVTPSHGGNSVMPHRAVYPVTQSRLGRRWEGGSSLSHAIQC